MDVIISKVSRVCIIYAKCSWASLGKPAQRRVIPYLVSCDPNKISTASTTDTHEQLSLHWPFSLIEQVFLLPC